MGTLEGFASPSAPTNPPCHPRASRGLAKPSRDATLPAKPAGSARELVNEGDIVEERGQRGVAVDGNGVELG
jgi:hypothetical protein